MPFLLFSPTCGLHTMTHPLPAPLHAPFPGEQELSPSFTQEKPEFSFTAARESQLSFCTNSLMLPSAFFL